MITTFAGAAGKDAALPRVFTVVSMLSGPLIGMGFDEQATSDARARIVRFTEVITSGLVRVVPLGAVTAHRSFITLRIQLQRSVIGS